jgi:putative transposase
MCIFVDATDYRRFLALFGDVMEHHEIRCWNYCLMPNHYHATVEPSQPNLSEAIRRINSSYAQWWNRRHSRVGHVFQGRFKDQIVQRNEYLLALSRYVAMNPVRAQLVERPDEWQWSSYRATSGLVPAPAFLDTGATLSLFGEGDRGAQAGRYVRFVTATRTDDETADRIRSNERILGDRTFKAGLRIAPARKTAASASPSS